MSRRCYPPRPPIVVPTIHHIRREGRSLKDGSMPTLCGAFRGWSRSVLRCWPTGARTVEWWNCHQRVFHVTKRIESVTCGGCRRATRP